MDVHTSNEINGIGEILFGLVLNVTYPPVLTLTVPLVPSQILHDLDPPSLQ